MADNIDDGGPAFPQESKWHTIEDQKLIIGPHVGISMRDYFAAAALTGTIAFPIPGHEKMPENAARFCYAYADAMLAARKAKP